MSFAESLTIVDKKTTVNTIVRKKAELSDLDNDSIVFMIPVDGGHVPARHRFTGENIIAFKTDILGISVTYTSLQNIYVL